MIFNSCCSMGVLSCMLIHKISSRLRCLNLLLRFSALHYSTRSWEFGGVLDSGFSVCSAPTYYHTSKYFYSQHLEVWKLIQN